MYVFILLPLSSCMGHFNIPYSSTGKPEPIPLILMSLNFVIITKFSFLVEIHADAPVSMQICSTSMLKEMVLSWSGIVRLNGRAKSTVFASSVQMAVSCGLVGLTRLLSSGTAKFCLDFLCIVVDGRVGLSDVS
jgi:hypothetical protein